MKPVEPMQCECLSWANDDFYTTVFGNGHHYRCEQFRPNEGAIKMLQDLIKGIRYWASQEDGVPDELWEAYSRACFLVEGKMPSEERT